METIGGRIKFLRKKEGLTSEELAERIGLKKASISSYENDRYDPSAKTIISICQEFNISADWLLMGKESIGPQAGESSINFEISPEEYDLIVKLRALDAYNQSEVVELINKKYDYFIKTKQAGRSTSTSSRLGANDENAATSETA
jgi:Predicted transcriptional regulators